jgi:GNAT superfamily N-acetyltransferase
MWLDLHTLNPELRHVQPQDLRIKIVDSEVRLDGDDLPYYERDFAAVRYKMTQLKAQKVWYFAAYLNERLVGHSTLCITTGPLGVAGLYDVGVIPAARNQGVGKAVTLAACSYASSLDCRHVLLNATGERMYEQLGFKTIGHGMTWWLDVTQKSK